MLPWKRHRREIDELREQVASDEEAAREALARTEMAKAQAVVSSRTSDQLLHQVRQNGWTELLLKSMGRRTT